MPRTIGKLTALTIGRLKAPGMYADGAGLYLQVTGPTAKSWIFRYTLDGRSREMGLGSASTFSLSEARARAQECRKLRQDGIDPVEARKKARAIALLESTKKKTFQECAEQYIETHNAAWGNRKHAQQWANTLAAYAYPVLGAVPVQLVDTTLVLKAIEPIWLLKPETASRVRSRIEIVLDWAKARGYRAGENPAAWRGHLDHTLPAHSRLRRTKHHAAISYRHIGAFMRELRQHPGTAARALEFLILTASRTAEVLGAQQHEFELDRTWVIPAERMKNRKDHRVPLSADALAIVQHARRGSASTFLFPNPRHHGPLSNMAMLAVLKRLNRAELTVHGFRSTFRDWAADTTNFPREVAEMALAHTIESKVEAAYRRGDLFLKRRQLMDAWAQHCNAENLADNVVPLNMGYSGL